MPKKLESNKSTGAEEVFEVLRRNPNSPHEVEVGGQKMRFGSSGAFRLHDRGKAEELFARHSPQVGDGSLVIIPTEKRTEGHRRSFTVRLPKNYKRESDG